VTEGWKPDEPPIRRGGFISRQKLATQTVRIIHAEGTEDEATYEEVAHVAPRSGFFDVEAPISQGDVVEVHDPRGGPGDRERRVAAEVKVHSRAPRMAQHIQVIWGEAPPPPVASAPPSAAPSAAPSPAPSPGLTFEDLHPDVQQACGQMFAAGDYRSAVEEAFRSLEVRAAVGADRGGAVIPGMYREAMLEIRDPAAHELLEPGDARRALEYLGFVSLLHRRLDLTEGDRE